MLRLSPIQTYLSKQIYDTLPTLPKVVTELISEYCSDQDLIELALQTPKIKYIGDSQNERLKHGGVNYTTENPETILAIKYCLTSPLCDPPIKEKVIRLYIAGRKTFENTQHICPEFEMLKIILAQLKCAGLVLNLDGVNLCGANLSALQLSGMTAIGADFSRCNLSKAELEHANLTGANLREINMQSACLNGAVLCNADFGRSDLSNAQLRHADLTGVNFFRTYLARGKSDKTDVTGVITGDASLRAFLAQFKKYFSGDTIVSGTVYLSAVQKQKKTELQGQKKNSGSCIIT